MQAKLVIEETGNVHHRGGRRFPVSDAWRPTASLSPDSGIEDGRYWPIEGWNARARKHQANLTDNPKNRHR